MLKVEEKTIELIKAEMASIPEKYHKPFNSKHEGYAVLLEEVRELEHVVFFGEKESKNIIASNLPINPISFKDEVAEHHKTRLREEAVQVAAMAIRIIQDLT